jgi:hypothetical protein
MNALRLLIVAGLLAGAPSAPVPAADEPAAPSGTWSLNNWIPDGSVHLKLSFHKGSTRWQWGNDEALADLDGLTASQLHAASANVRFKLQRDAGAFTFEGTMMLGIGRGSFHFVPDPTYGAKLAALGYAPMEDDGVSIMFLAVRDVSLVYAAEAKRTGLKGVQVSDLVRFLDHGIDLPFLRELADIGASRFTADDVVRFRDHGIDGAFLRDLKAAGRDDLSADDIVTLRDHGVKPDYIARVQSAGYPDLTVEQIIRLYEHGVN